SYYLSSSLYKPMEDHLKKIGLDLSTYVPVYNGYKARKEITFPLPEHVNVANCFKKSDRILFHLKHYKIRKNFLEHYNLSEYDVVHAHSLFSNGYIAYLAYKKYKTPYITAVRNTDLDIFFKKMVHL